MISKLKALFKEEPKETIELNVQPDLDTIITGDQTGNGHTHEWEIVAKTYASPIKDSSVANIQTATAANLSEKILFGVTILLWQCLVCKIFRKEEMLGSDTDTLQDLIDKAEMYGPQFIQKGNQTYVISQYSPVASQTGNIPVR